MNLEQGIRTVCKMKARYDTRIHTQWFIYKSINRVAYQNQLSVCENELK